jgi:hypothetical protein
MSSTTGTHSTNVIVDNQPTGCEVCHELWKVALECNINKPGIDGTSGRVISYIKCSNILEFFNIATQKCWEERTSSSNTYVQYPPQIHIKHSYSPSSTDSSTSSSSSRPNNLHIELQ